MKPLCLIFIFCAYATSVVDAAPRPRGEEPVNIKARAKFPGRKLHEAVWAPVLKKYGFDKVGEVIDPKFDLKTRSNCNSTQVEDTSGNCKDCGINKTPNADGTACVWTISGCPENQILAEDKTCQSCSGNEEPNSTGIKCVDPTAEDDDGGELEIEPPENEEEKDERQGNCPDGKILDPSIGGQDSSTEDPKCIADDDEKCPSGQIAASRKKGSTFDDDTYEPECGKDSDPDFECSDLKTFDYKYISPGGGLSVQHSCRDTQETEEKKKEKYNERVEEAKGVNERQKEREEQKKRTRGGWCWVSLAMAGAWTEMVDDVSSLSEDEVDGMLALYPDDMPIPSGNGTPPNYVVEYDLFNLAETEMDTSAFWGAIVQVIPRLFKGASGGAPKIVKELGTGARKAPSKSAISAAKNSKTIQKILKDDRYLDCLSTAADTAIGVATSNLTLDVPDARFSIDWGRTAVESTPAPEGKAQGGFSRMTLTYSTKEDLKGYDYAMRYTYDDSYWHRDRLPYEVCQKVADGLDNEITSLEGREDGKLRGDDNDAISSYWCTYNIDCEGRP
ncbi:hypothetical protein G7Z17_g11937 [Cylindrodendrum hubeiense]|uniref:Uncharacterized protein n=1 Tax=Cylindrodendrum hubeiense TaxID=595255 RepID=A0A9P5GZV5_9HYPO|nr:hypothetical protein G7Z17_g11937 [Cylindrodendrum hubeiense]